MTEHSDRARPELVDEDARAYVKQWVETGRVLEALRWRELAALDDARALEASDALLDSAGLVPVPTHRRRWSGLVEQQTILHRLVRP